MPILKCFVLTDAFPNSTEANNRTNNHTKKLSHYHILRCPCFSKTYYQTVQKHFFYLCLSNEILGTWTWKLSLLTWTHIVSGEINQKLSIGIETYACFLYRFQYISTLGTERKSFHKLRFQSALYKYNAKLYWWPLQWFIVDKFLMTRLKLNSAQKAATCSKKAPVQC